MDGWLDRQTHRHTDRLSIIFRVDPSIVDRAIDGRARGVGGFYPIYFLMDFNFSGSVLLVVSRRGYLGIR